MSKQNAPVYPGPDEVITWTPGAGIIVDDPAPSATNIGWVGTPEGNFAQPQAPHARVIEPAPGSLWGDAVGRTMVVPTGPTLYPEYPPEQQLFELPQWDPVNGWVSSAS